MALALCHRYRLLKMDIEGFEWPVFEDYFSRNETLPFTEILVGPPGTFSHDHC